MVCGAVATYVGIDIHFGGKSKSATSYEAAANRAIRLAVLMSVHISPPNTIEWATLEATYAHNDEHGQDDEARYDTANQVLLASSH